MPHGVMQINHEQGELMKFMVKIAHAKKGIEVGTFTGYSSICFAEAIGPDGHLLCLDVSKEYTDVARAYWEEGGFQNRITLKLGPAIDTLKAMVEDESQIGAWDFAFVDADKPSQIAYYECLTKLVKKGGFILVDNVNMHGSVLDPDAHPIGEVIHQFNEFVKNDERGEMQMISQADGIMLIYVK